MLWRFSPLFLPPPALSVPFPLCLILSLSCSFLSPFSLVSQGLLDVLCEACVLCKYEKPTPIQEQAIPAALDARDVVGIAKTGSGKTAAFALPVLQSLLNSSKPARYYHALVMAPTR